MDLHFPPLHEPYTTALKQAVDYIIERYNPVGLIASGSVLRGEGDATSDLDLYVIHEQGWRQRAQRWFNGVPAEIFVNPPQMIRRYFVDERQEGRFVTAHMLATGAVILNRGDVVERLRAEAAQELHQPPGLSEAALTMQRYMAATLLEDALDIEAKDPINALFLLEQAMPQMIQYAFLAANHPLPRAKKTITALAALDPVLGELARRFYTEADPAQRFTCAKEFAQRILGVTGFFSWEGERQDVEL
ncbi:MAG: nucleotidyltransferase domain-containing protein [Caldilineaceae bacterium]|nr:nucleotidyltransferase domain-containing protein [Caldilineaceae bacterium]